MLEPSRWKEQSPPSPALTQDDNQGQTLLRLIRSLENEDNQREFERILDVATESLRSLARTCSRKGLLRGDSRKAEMVLPSAGGGAMGPESLRKKRGRKRGDQKGQSSQAGESATAASTMDENLIFSAVIRVLSWQPAKLQSALCFGRMSIDLCTAVSEHLKSSSRKQLSRIGLAEYEILSSTGIPLLKALCKASTHMIRMVHNSVQCETLSQPEMLFDTTLDGNSEEVAMLQSCLRAAASFVSLFGTKLSRSSGLISELQELGLTALTAPFPKTQTAAAQLLAALPLTGALYDKKAAANKSIGEQWSDFLMGAVVSLSRVLKNMVAVAQKLETASDSWQLSKTFELFLDNVKTCFHETLQEEEERTSAFRVLVHGLFQLIRSVMSRDYRCRGGDAMLDARISVEEVLNLLESMIFFSFASETLYFATKKRLRLEGIDGGVLSPASTVTEVAGYVKLLGHGLFDVLVTAVGCPPLLPHSKRMLRMVSRALLMTASSDVQKALAPSATSAQWDGDSRRWLHTSISLRAQAVRSFGVTISMFGLDPTRNSGTPDASSWVSNKPSGAEDCVTVVGGCLLEQLVFEDKDATDWGTLGERVALTVNSVRSLECTILSCGGFMPLKLRVLVESIAAAGLNAILLQDAHPIASCTVVRVSILQLGSACVSVPWNSGASSSLRERLREASLRCRTYDTETGIAASSALRLCESLCTPRVPALYVDKQIHDFLGWTQPVSARSLVNEVQKVKDELVARDEASSAALIRKEEEEQEQRKRRKKGDTAKAIDSEHQPLQAVKLQQEEKESSMGGNQEQPKHASDETRHKTVPIERDAAYGKADKRGGDEPRYKSVPMERGAADDNVDTKPVDGEEEEEDDFLPGIVDDVGPDEEDA